ncbi:unnamed protein product [Ambrosiozyma monospora]|uniref:Unnamed protein product n=1 Tax=Ambrosiozyma monospora TaxID=43982 RepID=A0ACB5T4N2_AMBMO|nr:unnamed protein product [Ambrosiozyma monospora]
MGGQSGGFYDTNANYSVIANDESDSENDTDGSEERHAECINRLGFDLEYPELLPYVLEAQNDAIRWGKQRQRETNLKREQEAREREQQNQQTQQTQQRQQQQQHRPILKSSGPGAFGLYQSSDDDDDDRAVRAAIDGYAATLESDSDNDSDPDGFGGYYMKAQNEAIALSKKWQREADEKRQREKKEKEEQERREKEQQQHKTNPIFKTFGPGVFGLNHSSDDERDDRVLQNFFSNTFNPAGSHQADTNFNTTQSNQVNSTFNFGSRELPVLDIATLPTANQSSTRAATVPTTTTPENGSRARNNRRNRRGYRGRGRGGRH